MSLVGTAHFANERAMMAGVNGSYEVTRA
jgi:hypothetical protein